jgi:glycosyltransferase involved in cell wall biosynthesis
VAHLTGDGARLVLDAEAGVVVTPGDTVALAAAIEEMVDAGPRAWARYGESGRNYYDANLSAGSITATIINSLSKTTQNHGGKD